MLGQLVILGISILYLWREYGFVKNKEKSEEFRRLGFKYWGDVTYKFHPSDMDKVKVEMNDAEKDATIAEFKRD